MKQFTPSPGARRHFCIPQLVAAAALTAATLACSLFSRPESSAPAPTVAPVEPATEQPAPSATLSPTSLPTPNPTPTPLLETSGGQVEVWDYAYSEDFSSTPANWNLEVYEDQAVKASYTLQEGAYLWQVDAVQDMSLLQTADPAILLPGGDFLLSVSIGMQSIDDELAAGLLFQVLDLDNLYFAKLTSAGSLSVYVLQNDEWQTLVEPQTSQHYLTGQVNRLIVQRQGSHYQVQINDYPEADFEDARFVSGNVGLAVELDAGEQGDFTFDELRLMKPGSSAAMADEPTPTMMPMGASYQVYEGQAGEVNYSLEHPFTFLHTTSGGWEQFCLDAPEKLCVSLQPHAGFQGDVDQLATEVVQGFSAAVGDYAEIHRQHTQTAAQGLAAVWVSYTYTWQGEELYGERLFVVSDGVGFDMAVEAEPLMMEIYRTVIKYMLDRFRVGP